MDEDIKILEKMKANCIKGMMKGAIYTDKKAERKAIAIENLIKGYRELDKDNNDLRRLYRRTAVKLKENGHEEVADYFLAQINEVPTFVVEDDIDYYAEYYKMKTKIRETEENLKIATAMLTKGQYPEKNKGDNDFNKQFIPKSKIKEKIEEIQLPNIIVGGRRNCKTLEYGKKLGKLEVLQELMEDK